MKRLLEVAVSDLSLDDKNARLLNPGGNQQATAILLTKDQGDKLVRLAKDIVENGMDPLSLPAIVASEGKVKRYKVIEGNRRILALKALETPALVSAALPNKAARQLTALSKQYMDRPLEFVSCILFDDETQVRHWIELRHTGQNQGVGLVEWDSDAKNRYESRHSGHRNPTGQVIDFVENNQLLNPQQSKQKITTNLERLLSSPRFRQKVGIFIDQGQVFSYFPYEEIKKPLTHILEDLKSGNIKVKDLYNAQDRTNYTNSIPANALPIGSKRFKRPIPLNDLSPATKANPRAASTDTKRTAKRKMPQQRTSVIPGSVRLNVTDPRINAIYKELRLLSTDQFANASSVLLRVFLELSVDHYIDDNKLMNDKDRQSKSLAERMKLVADNMLRENLIGTELRKAIDKVANQRSGISPSISTFNQYVHNKYVFPKSSEVQLAWDELQPFIERIWQQ